MHRIPLAEAQPGMALAAGAVNAQQMLLLKKGAELTEKSLHMLKSWGVDAVWVAHPEGEAERAPCPTDDCRDIQQEITARFGDTLADPIMEAICRSAIQIVSERQAMEE